MNARQRSENSHTERAAAVLTAVGILLLPGLRPVFLRAGEVAATAAEKTALGPFADAEKSDSPLWWLARAEEQAALWGNAHQQVNALAEIAKLLADRDRIEEALAVAKRIGHGPPPLSARYRIAAAYARAGKLEAAETLARLGSRADAYVEINCHIAEALAAVGRIEEAEKIVATLGRRPSNWNGKWEPPDDLVSAKARIHAACAAACAKAGRPDAYRRHIEKSEALAKSIPGDVNKMMARIFSSRYDPADPPKPNPNPINAIYKIKALQSAILARAKAADYEGARKTLSLIPAGRYRDSQARILVGVLARGGALKEARAVADTIETHDHRDIACLSLVAAYTRTGELTAAKALTAQMDNGDRRALAQMHLAAAAGGSGQAADMEAALETAAAEARLEAAGREELHRMRAANPPRIPPPAPPSTPRLRPKLYREAARILARNRTHHELAAWIKTLPGAESRFYAMLGVADRLLGI